MEPQGYVESGNNLQPDFTSKREGKIARKIEEQTSKIPTDVFLWAAGASILGSLVFQAVGMFGGARTQIKQLYRPTRTPASQFLGMWAPTLLILGLYSKLVKGAGSNRITG